MSEIQRRRIKTEEQIKEITLNEINPKTPKTSDTPYRQSKIYKTNLYIVVLFKNASIRVNGFICVLKVMPLV